MFSKSSKKEIFKDNYKIIWYNMCGLELRLLKCDIMPKMIIVI